MKNFFQSLGILLSIVIVVLATVLLLYLSYLGALILVLGGLFYVIYNLTSLVNSGVS
jgi:hypothetical protein